MALAKILLIDDDTDQLTLLSMLFENNNFSVIAISDPEAGMKLLNSTNVDVIITDLAMPKVDGSAFLEKLSSLEKTKHVVKVALSASTKLQAGDPLLKYVNLSVLKNEVRHVLIPWLKEKFN